MDSRIGEVLVLSLKICDPSVHSDDLDIEISDGDTEWLCLLHSAISGNTWNNSVAARVGCRGSGSLERSCLGPRYFGSTMPTRVL